MLAEQIYLPPVASGFPTGLAVARPSWYAVRTRARHEKRVCALLQEKAVPVFLPLVQQIHRWSDRQARVEVPLFSCYLFVRILAAVETRLRVLETPGALGLAGSRKEGTPVADSEIDSLRAAISAKAAFQTHPFTSAGLRVRVRGGALDGVEGIVAGESTNRRIVLTVEILRRSVSVGVEGYDLELI